jgi:hypothetical protein
MRSGASLRKCGLLKPSVVAMNVAAPPDAGNQTNSDAPRVVASM